ncbi:MAG: hypothetical protein K6F06_07960 [Bacteroidales bacterium]|nr:hypothetical protein [Bacteroidales bacterium]
MDTKPKVIYEAPSAQVFEVAQEGVICQSNDGIYANRGGYGTATEEEW